MPLSAVLSTIVVVESAESMAVPSQLVALVLTLLEEFSDVLGVILLCCLLGEPREALLVLVFLTHLHMFVPPLETAKTVAEIIIGVAIEY